MPIADNPQIEQIRHILLSVGWREHMAPGIASQMETAKSNLAVAEHERTGEMSKWSTERIGGYIVGLGWSLNIWLQLVKRYDAERALAAQDERMAAQPEPSAGSPYVPEPAATDSVNV